MKPIIVFVAVSFSLLSALLLWAPAPVANAATCTVTSAVDDGSTAGTLRVLLADATCDTITFGGSYTIPVSVTLGALVISRNLTIDGTGYSVTLSGDSDGDGTRDAEVLFVASGVTATLQNLTVTKGIAEYGGGILNRGVLTVDKVALTSNTSVVGAQGGAIYSSGTLTVTNSTLSDNYISYEGAAIFSTGTLIVTDSTFTGNTTNNYGGGLFIWSGTATLTNTTFSGNSSTGGGGIYNMRGKVWIANSTFSGNSASMYGEAINADAGPVTITNSIFVDGTCAVTNLSGGTAGTISGTNNLADDTFCASTASSTILLGTLGNYGGSTQTIPLLPGSAAIDRTSSDCPTTDQRGVTRSSPTCDIGAFESGGFAMAISSGNNQSILVNTPFTDSLVVAVAANTTGEPVAGGQVVFVGPLSGTGTDPITNTATITNGKATQAVTANSTTGGPYTVTASVGGTSVAFSLTNVCWDGIAVSNASDSGVGSLRWAMAGICSSGTVTFAGDYTIPLSSTLGIDHDMTIDGAGHRVTVSGDTDSDGTGDVRVFSVGAGVTTTLKNLTVTKGNSGTSAGGGIYSNQGNLTVLNSTLSNNSASAGGAIYLHEATLTVSNSTFTSNSTTNYGGAVYVLDATFTAMNSTFYGNGATKNGGVLFAARSAASFANSIMIKGTTGTNCYYTASGTNNLVDDTSCGFSTTDSASILLGALGNYGGSSATYPLLPGSVAIDATSSNCPTIDQRGYARSSSTCDIGAFESGGFTQSITGGNNQSAPVNTTYTSPLVVAVTPKTSGEPVDGGVVTMVGPLTGASTAPITHTVTVTSGAATQLVVANSTAGGPYTITASTTGATSVNFRLTNIDCASSITVGNANDSGVSSLREALVGICSGGTITFAGNYTIPLASTLTVDKNITIDGVGHRVTVSGDTNSDGTGDVRVLSVDSGVAAVLNMLTIATGYAADDGGGINNSGTLAVLSSALIGNRATIGGGIYNQGTLTVTNSTFSGNSATDSGGGIANDGTSVSVTNSTWAGNRAASSGGGLYNIRNTATVANSIWIKGTTGTNCSGTITGGKNLADDSSCGSGTSTSSIILLGTLANYGGSTQTYPLLPGSTAIDGTSTNCPATDQRGSSRASATCDIGAFESGGFTLAVSSGNRQVAFVGTAFAAPLITTIAAKTGGEPVDGGRVTFTPPISGASASITGSPATISGASASVTATANSTIGGPYSVVMSTAGATSVNFELTNTMAGTTITLTSAPNPSTWGQKVILTATVAGTNGTPAGTVTFYEQTGVGASAAFARTSVAQDVRTSQKTTRAVKSATTGATLQVTEVTYTYTTSSLAFGTHTFVAVYSGDSQYGSGTSNTLVQTVNAKHHYYFPWVSK